MPCWTLVRKYLQYCGVFFFSSRRRHTRWTGDWSSDVCSSDLLRGGREPLSRDPRLSPLGNAGPCQQLLLLVDERPDGGPHPGIAAAPRAPPGSPADARTPGDLQIGRASCRERV